MKKISDEMWIAGAIALDVALFYSTINNGYWWVKAGQWINAVWTLLGFNASAIWTFYVAAITYAYIDKRRFLRRINRQ